MFKLVKFPQGMAFVHWNDISVRWNDITVEWDKTGDWLNRHKGVAAQTAAIGYSLSRHGAYSTASLE